MEYANCVRYDRLRDFTERILNFVFFVCCIFWIKLTDVYRLKLPQCLIDVNNKFWQNIVHLVYNFKSCQVDTPVSNSSEKKDLYGLTGNPDNDNYHINNYNYNHNYNYDYDSNGDGNTKLKFVIRSIRRSKMKHSLTDLKVNINMHMHSSDKNNDNAKWFSLRYVRERYHVLIFWDLFRHFDHGDYDVYRFTLGQVLWTECKRYIIKLIISIFAGQLHYSIKKNYQRKKIRIKI